MANSRMLINPHDRCNFIGVFLSERVTLNKFKASIDELLTDLSVSGKGFFKSIILKNWNLSKAAETG